MNILKINKVLTSLANEVHFSLTSKGKTFYIMERSKHASRLWGLRRVHKVGDFHSCSGEGSGVPEAHQCKGVAFSCRAPCHALSLAQPIRTARGGSRHSQHSHGRMSDFMAEKLSVINSRLHNICNVYFLI